jgi:hypothetical protein
MTNGNIPPVIWKEEVRIPSGWEIGDWFLHSENLPAMTQKQAADYSKEHGNVLLTMRQVVSDIMLPAKYSGDLRIRQHIQKLLRQGMNTQTRAIIAPEGYGQDSLIEGIYTPEAKQVPVNLIGKAGLMKESELDETIEKLTGQSKETLAKLLGYFNETPNHIKFFPYGETRPEQIQERVARFYADSDWAVLSCYLRNPDDRYPAFRVSRKKS